MILIYLDESGTNYQRENRLYVDGPFLIFGAMLVYEDVYWSMERLFIDLIGRYFGIDNWLNSEVHATDIWAGNDLSNNLSYEERRNFFDEFLQLCGKMGLPYIFSFNLKYHNKNIFEKNLDMMKASLCLLTGIEHKLADIHQTGVLICDTTTGAEKLKTKDIISINLEKEYLLSSQALLKQFYEMTSWRSTNKLERNFTIQPKYQAETMSAYLIDRVHFVSSDDSLFLQMCDIMTFIIQRTLVFDYLISVDKERADLDKLPISLYGWAMMRKQIISCHYDHESQDVFFINVEDLAFEGESLLINFPESTDYSQNLKEHYRQLQEES